MKRKKLEKLILSAIFLCIGFVLPMFTMQIKEIGDSLLPMHISVMLCGLICGYKYGFLVGLILPFLRSLIFSMPPLYPNSIWMSAELCTYGLVIGIVYSLLKTKSVKNVYIALISAMVTGRIVWGIFKTLLLGLNGKSFTLSAFFIGGFADAAIGIVLQLILIPVIMKIINMKAGIKND